ncbi:LytR/AlgR family response regulator transcription factor [Oceanobacter mangrovi]|uniref:LytR/AlgR family response regulator transcription factor n=1 Tax=Oceanobacter mangrovi TaxID=2862510 RepID=UPI001C8D2AE0|nr:LytTR family DNA-binding domain-containing protein [Oceanobacter mangrovi]
MTYRLLLVDDEPLARDRLLRLLEVHKEYDVVGTADSGEQALEWLAGEHADVLLLDIQMPGLTGLETAAVLNQQPNSPLVVFCTAYDDFALDAFGVNAVDYLLKPIRRDDLARALQRVSERLQSQPTPLLPQQQPQPSAATKPHRVNLTARSHNGLELIPVQSVFYFLADQKYVNAVHEQGETLIDESLKQLEDEFGERFVRVHRSALVARDRMVRLEPQSEGGHKIYLTGLAEGIPVSRRHLANVRRLMKSL